MRFDFCLVLIICASASAQTTNMFSVCDTNPTSCKYVKIEVKGLTITCSGAVVEEDTKNNYTLYNVEQKRCSEPFKSIDCGNGCNDVARKFPIGGHARILVADVAYGTADATIPAGTGLFQGLVGTGIGLVRGVVDTVVDLGTGLLGWNRKSAVTVPSVTIGPYHRILNRYFVGVDVYSELRFITFSSNDTVLYFVHRDPY